MADTKIKDLTEKATGASTDEFVINDVADGNTDKKLGMDGIRITQSQITDLSAANTFARVVKKADETVDTSTTFQDDDELVVALSANKTYYGVLRIFFTSATDADFKYKFTIPSGATAIGNGTAIQPTGSGTMVELATGHALGSIVNENIVGINFRVVVGTAGNLQLQWAQNTSQASNTTVLEGSALIMWEELA